jgi:AcrR family transcriptional regulator
MLAEEIVTAALQLIDQAGTQESVTLRAVAREIGIAAPSIYAHFADRDAIMTAVVARLFDDLAAEVKVGIATASDPVEQLVAGCQSYVRYGEQHPARYQVLFSDRLAPRLAEDCEPLLSGSGQSLGFPEGTESFVMLANAINACITAGVSASTDVIADGTAIWTALHGTVTLRAARPGFPWPESIGGFVRQFVLTLAKVTSPA